MQHEWTQLELQVSDFDGFLDGLMTELTLKSNVLRLKLKSYTKWSDLSEIFKFVGTAIITFLTAILGLLLAFLVANSQFNPAVSPINSTNDLDPAINFSFAIATLAVSSGLGLMILIVRYCGWEKKARTMVAFKHWAMISSHRTPCYPLIQPVRHTSPQQNSKACTENIIIFQ